MNPYAGYETDFGTLPAPFPQADRSLTQGTPSLANSWRLSNQDFRQTFFGNTPSLEYVAKSPRRMRIVTHPQQINDLAQKAAALEMDTSNIIKTLFYACDGQVFMFAIPSNQKLETRDPNLRTLLNINPRDLRFLPEHMLPPGMSRGTCHPFVPQNYKCKLIFDREKVIHSTRYKDVCDFAITLNTGANPHQMSLQMTYAAAYEIVCSGFPNRVFCSPLKYC